MRIRVRSDGRNIRLALPTRLIFSKWFIKLGLRIGSKYSGQKQELPPEAVDALCTEIRRIKKKHGSWELVDVRSAEGDTVQITL